MITTEKSVCSKILTLLAAHNQVLEEVDGDALFRRQDCPDVNREELVHLALAPELGGEGGSGDALLAGVDPLVIHDNKIKLILSVGRERGVPPPPTLIINKNTLY